MSHHQKKKNLLPRFIGANGEGNIGGGGNGSGGGSGWKETIKIKTSEIKG